MLVKFKQKSYGPNYKKFWAFRQKTGFSITIFAILEDVSVAEIIV